jgi:hypothetical protein
MQAVLKIIAAVAKVLAEGLPETAPSSSGE